MSVTISVSIVLFKNDGSVRKPILDFLNSSITGLLFLVDNSPTNQLEKDLADIIKHERVRYIYNNANLGFGAGHNVAIRQILDKGTYHLVLNPDVTFHSDVLQQLADFMNENTDVGLVMPKVLYPNGELQYACKLLPTPADLIFRRFLPSSITQKKMEHFELRGSGYNRVMEVPYLSGCFMFLRTDALKKVGLFDERFFMYPEDIDLTRRIHKQYRTLFYPQVSIVHEHGQGSYKNLRLLWIHITNMIRYFNKWGWIFDKERKQVNKKILAQLK